MGARGPFFVLDYLEGDFDKYVLDRFFQMGNSVKHLAHYTTAETAFNIISGRQFWMSNLDQMNDFEEFNKGKQLTLQNLIRKMEQYSYFSISYDNIAEQFELICSEIESQLFCLSFSMFDMEKDPFDSLEMWDRYGDRGEGLCLIFSSERLLLKQQTKDPIFWLPLIYCNDSDFSDEFDKMFEEVILFCDEGDDDESEIIAAVARILVIYAMIYKHRGFEGEAEFRLLHSPAIHPQNCIHISRERKVIRNLTRDVAIIDTNGYESGNGIKINFESTLEYVLICQKVWDKHYTILRNLLDNNNLAHVKIIKSNIPYR